MDISPLMPQEWPWLLARSVATGWDQLTPWQQGLAAPAAVADRVEKMLSRALAGPGSVALVARDNGTPVAYTVLAVIPDDLTGSLGGLFVDFWVEPEWRGRGIGRRLLAAGEDRCRAQGMRFARRMIAAHNEHSLRHALADGCQIERHQLVKILIDP